MINTVNDWSKRSDIYIYIPQIYEYPRLTIIETEYQNPPKLILKHGKWFSGVNKSHEVHLSKMTLCMRDSLLKPIQVQWPNRKLVMKKVNNPTDV